MSTSSLSGAQNVMHPRPLHKPPTFQQLDTNADSALSLDELKSQAPGGAKDAKAASRAEALFKAMDQDGDGSVTSSEKDAFDTQMTAQRQQMQFMTQLMAGGQQAQDAKTEVFNQTDSNGDGSISLDELGTDAGANSIGADGLKKLFSLIDSDGNGAISETESSSFFDSVTAAITEAMGPPPGDGSPDGGIPDGMSLAQALSGDDSDDDNDQDTPFDLLGLAQNAYSAGSKQTNILDQLQAIFDGAA